MLDSGCSSLTPKVGVGLAIPWDNPPCSPDLLLHQSSPASVWMSTYSYPWSFASNSIRDGFSFCLSVHTEGKGARLCVHATIRGVDKFLRRVGGWDVVSAYMQIFEYSPLKIQCTAIFIRYDEPS